MYVQYFNASLLLHLMKDNSYYFICCLLSFQEHYFIRKRSPYFHVSTYKYIYFDQQSFFAFRYCIFVHYITYQRLSIKLKSKTSPLTIHRRKLILGKLKINQFCHKLIYRMMCVQKHLVNAN